MSYNPNSYPPPPGGGGYPPPPRQEYQQSAYANQGYGSPQGSYSEYRPPSEDQYRTSPRTSGMQVGQYSGEYHSGRRNSGPYAASQYRDNDGGYYASPSQAASYYDRPSSRGSRGSRRERARSRSRSGSRPRERGEKKGHEAEKKVGATLLGGAVGGWAGHEFGHSNSLVTMASALAGAYAGHKLEAKHEKKKRERRESGGRGFDDGSDERRPSRSRIAEGAGAEAAATVKATAADEGIAIAIEQDLHDVMKYDVAHVIVE
ncbi:uncharacterized protein A1O9_05570 [Exophiala aquamarina CBS 119918]|uniref:Uncharacterized protein n=1 Tax=Exophiala aquamarina CBS 119918 TaxID=1182545 RepID=A0A072PD01_9EURO|nr:uncharacterized protein A1O9_05570 [Exophiala aquamarina CBS 119918]KEF57652.1 hypothetical protein A1O9_05570 [Exophiala aquamarina CBS 119918]